MKNDTKKKTFFTKKLMEWFGQNHRPLPWKGEKNPYFVWLSEIILQQTRVEQGLPYFEKFKVKYPTVHDLANAPEDEVMKLWEGLGYYSRARNLHFTAKHISENLDGVFPNTFEEILKLKGVGNYTAAAIASFAFDLPNAVVDGNVYRVLSRIFGIETPIDTTAGKKEFSALAQDLLDKKKPAKYNQAIMDFGATHCMPANPKCENCLMKKKCFAFQENRVSNLPIKSKKLVKKNRFFNYLVINFDNSIFIRKRVEKDIWRDLYEFPMIESQKLFEEKNDFSENETFLQISNENSIQFKNTSKPFKQLLTHQKIMARFWEVSIENNSTLLEEKFIKIERKNLSTFAFPKIIDNYLKNKEVDLFSNLIE